MVPLDDGPAPGRFPHRREGASARGSTLLAQVRPRDNRVPRVARMRMNTLSRSLIPALATLPLTLAGLACSDNDPPLPTVPMDAGVPEDLGVPDLGIEDAGFDAGTPDFGPPPPCLFDQGGPENRGCEPGFVCNLRTGECVEGTPCDEDRMCNACSSIRSDNQIDCGHGYAVTAWCDMSHGVDGRGVCARSRAPCEPCQTDADCGYLDFFSRSNRVRLDEVDANRCLAYDDGNSYCGRPARGDLTCPLGFVTDSVTGQCRRPNGCPAEPAFCPETSDPDQTCNRTGQICAGDLCESTATARCATNEWPGGTGVCLDYCRSNADCPVDAPFCNVRNGLCGIGCDPGSCTGGEVCHMDGRCAPRCETDDDCRMSTSQNMRVYGEDSYCNIRGRSAPALYKGPGSGRPLDQVRDEFSCAPLGCEINTDCRGDEVCNPLAEPYPACEFGCFVDDDCPNTSFICKLGLPDVTYVRGACRDLPNIGPGDVGICCDPGCNSRALNCDGSQFCCGQANSPYEDPMDCLFATNSSTVPADIGLCFDMPVNPFCTAADLVAFTDGTGPLCASRWDAGLAMDPEIPGGRFREQEFVFPVTYPNMPGCMSQEDCATDKLCVNFGMAGAFCATPMCGVTCDPDNADPGCPSGWGCEALFVGCAADSDCGGLPCVGANPDMNMLGRCQCGENGAVSTACPSTLSVNPLSLGTRLEPGPAPVERPRCRDPERDPIGPMFCVAAYNCRGPGAQDAVPNPDRDNLVYPPECPLP